MTFYQELQLNQAGSKKVIRESETTQEKWRHILIYLLKIAMPSNLPDCLPCFSAS